MGQASYLFIYSSRLFILFLVGDLTGVAPFIVLDQHLRNWNDNTCDSDTIQ